MACSSIQFSILGSLSRAARFPCANTGGARIGSNLKAMKDEEIDF